MANLRSGPGWADGDTSQYDSTMHNSHSEQQGGGTVKKNEGPAKPPLFVYCRWSSSVHPPLKPAGHTCDRNLRCLRVKEITSCLGCRTLCVDGSSQATFLTKRSLSPSPRCLRCSGVPFGCSSGHGRMFCYGSQGISIWMTPKKLVSAHDITPLRREDSDKRSYY